MKRIWESLGKHHAVRLLQLAALLRNICQGIAVVDLSLYLKELGWSGGAIGGLLVGAGLFRTTITSLAGVLNARLGPKQYLLLFESIAALAALTVTATDNKIALCAAVVIAGFGRGHTGSGGPVTPIERAWLAAYGPKSTDHIFGVNALLGFFGMGIGAIVASSPSLWSKWLPGALAYRPLFALLFVITLSCLFVVAKIPGGKRKQGQQQSAQAEPVQAATSKSERTTGQTGSSSAATSLSQPSAANRERLVHLVNLVNGIAVTLSSTMTSYWLAAKFNVSPGKIGIVMAVSYVATGGVAMASIYIAKRLGSVKSIIYLQLVGIAFVLALPWAPWFWLASLLNVGCTAFNLGTRGNRSSVAVTQRQKQKKRSWQSQTHSFVLRLSTVLWPGAFGRMVDEGHFVLPFYIAAAVQFGSTLWFGKVNKDMPAVKKSIREQNEL